ncbi:MAG: gamma-glutamylcyclotransferase family protein [Cumulibacter sp.]
MSLYAAYGADMDPERMLGRCPLSPVAGTGWLSGWRLAFGGEEHAPDGALCTIVPDEVGAVFVVLYDIAEFDAAALDEWMQVPSGLYRRMRTRVHDGARGVAAWTHVLDVPEGGLPSLSTTQLIAHAAEVAGAPDDYVASLRNRPTTGL